MYHSPRRVRSPLIPVALLASLAACAPVDDASPDTIAQASMSQGGQPCTMTCYRDDDNDEYGRGAALPTTYCSCGAGLAAVNGDCNDNDPAARDRYSCYVDNDGDHWGTGSRTSLCAPASCFGSGASNNPGDLDDRDRTVHPESAEVAGDGLDNDQDGMVDETEFDINAGGYLNTTTSFYMDVRINDASVSRESTLYARVTWWALRDSATRTTTAVLPVAHVAGSRTTAIYLGGLPSSDAGVVIAATVQWQTRVAAYGVPDTYTPRSTPSDTYYSMTSPTSTNDTAGARWNMVMRAIDDWDESEKGGIREWESNWRTTRYGVSAPATAWCSEFYATMARDELLYMNPQDEGPLDLATEVGTTSMSNWFAQYAGMLDAMPTNATLADRAPGTWLGVDTNGDGTMNHTQMLLAWDASAATPSYWVVQGNSTGNSGGRWLEAGHGQRVSIARYTAENTNGTRRVHYAGRVHAAAMLDP